MKILRDHGVHLGDGSKLTRRPGSRKPVGFLAWGNSVESADICHLSETESRAEGQREPQTERLELGVLATFHGMLVRHRLE